MNERRKSLFLERQSYRRRRLVDVIRMLPVLGALLWMVPLLWPTDAQGGVATSKAIIFIFVVWAGLVLASALLTRALARGDAGDDQEVG
ncbi:hypothetical protein [Thiosulfatihalobacter marinus]|uniref:hypothetical protein n=1 Tax=Thiosulfatihalobacter marinus TaxID=2792481 RepID=UPI0018D97392